MPRPLSRSERQRLCDTALELGPSEPTLCGDWTVKDLVVHLLVRERDLTAAPGIFVPALCTLTERAQRRVGRDDFPVLVERVRTGPPWWWPTSLPPLDRATNTVELVVHHEDLRRAQKTWKPRDLTAAEQDALYRALRLVTPLTARKVEGGLRVRRTDTGASSTWGRGHDPVTVVGTPVEIALFLYGRREQSQVELEGSDAALARLDRTGLGL